MTNKDTQFNWDDGWEILPWFHRMMADFPKTYYVDNPSVDYVYDSDEVNAWREKWLSQFKEDES